MIDTDSTLLRQYVNEGSETAFAELVRRHIDLVYSTALRQVGGNVHRAQDVTQTVFCELVRKAPSLIHHRVLSAWLYITARFVGARFHRTESRRIAREMNAQSDNQPWEQPAPDATWKELKPVLDDAMEQLGEKDRSSIVLRFFEDKPLAAVGTSLGLNENAARMRVDRAINKLRCVLERRGFHSSASVLGTVLAANAVAPAPAGLAAGILGPALATVATGATAGAGATFALLQFMTTAKLGTGIAALAIMSAVGTYIAMDTSNAKLEAKVAALQDQLAATTPTPAPKTEEEGRHSTDNEHLELLRIRGEVGMLRKSAVEFEQALREKTKAETGLSADQLQALERSRGFVELIGSAKMNFARGWFDAVHAFAQAHDGRMPETLDQAEPHFNAPEGWQWTTGLWSKDDFEVVFHGSLHDLMHPERTIILREKEAYTDPESGVARRTYAFADGHSEIHHARDNNFERWEKERMVATTR